tara:strand:+ start:229 stop:894 length:666 start_codon:yes stop_codon:yes gene_type:complete
MYKNGKDLVLTFSPYEPGCISSLFVGVQIWYYQNIMKNGMNQFFHDKSLLFYTTFKDVILSHFKNHPTGHLYITGISMGGALSQCFYYHLRKDMNCNTTIMTFGSPRVGDATLRGWFYDQAKLKIVNYALFKKFGLCKRIDPVVTLPHMDTTQHYTNNANLQMMYHNKISDLAEASIDQDDFRLSVGSFVKKIFVTSALDKYWEEIHNIGEYYDGLPHKAD